MLKLLIHMYFCILIHYQPTIQWISTYYAHTLHVPNSNRTACGRYSISHRHPFIHLRHQKDTTKIPPEALSDFRVYAEVKIWVEHIISRW